MRLRILLASWLTMASVWMAVSHADELDFSTWQHMPVFRNGRVMPVNTFARMAVESVCNRANPYLDLEGLSDEARGLPEFSETKKMFPDGRRKFTAAEILFSWMVEPERWEYVPFLIAEHEELRADILGLPVLSSKGKHLKYVSPYDLKQSDRFQEAASELSEKQRNRPSKELKLTNTETAIEELFRAYLTYRSVAYDPFASDRRRFSDELVATIGQWKKATEPWEESKTELTALTPPVYEEDVEGQFAAFQTSFQSTLLSISRGPSGPNQAKPDWDAPERQAAELASTAAGGSKSLSTRERPEAMSEADWKQLCTQADLLTSQTKKLVAAVGRLGEEHAEYQRIAGGPFRSDARRFVAMLSATVGLWNDASTAWEKGKADLTGQTPAVYQEDMGRQMDAVGSALSPLIEMIQRDAVDPIAGERILGNAEGLAAQLAETATLGTSVLFERDRPETISESSWKQLRSQAHLISSRATDLVSAVKQTQLALFDSERAVRLMPSLNAAALEKNRETGDDAQPWVSLPTLLFCGDDVYRNFLCPDLPEAEGTPIFPEQMTRSEYLQRLASEGNAARTERVAFADAAAAYLDRESTDRAERFAAAMDRFAGEVRRLGESIEPARAKMELSHPDEELITLTAYPTPGATDAEVHYYQLDPFKWTWVASFLSLCFLGTAFGAIRQPMYWIGILLLIVGLTFSIYGLALRTYVTGWAPVTNMFETVVFVALVTGLLGLFFAILPLFGAGFQRAWRMTAVPGTPEAGSLDAEDLAAMNPSSWTAVRVVMMLPRLYLIWDVFFRLTWAQYGVGTGYAAIRLVPRSASINDQVVWIVGLAMLAIALWLVPRMVISFVLSLIAVPWSLTQSGLTKPMGKSVDRKIFALVGAGTACVVGLIAYFAPIDLWDKNINPLMPVLRDNFWLTLHVLSITASYGAGFLAWGLGITAMVYYTFGRYRDPLPATNVQAKKGKSADGRQIPATSYRRVPEQCVGLSGFIYKAIQVAVVLLAAGTILGGLWADVSWGRFWGWDPKEVWALVSLLVYIGILHFRFIGILRDFSLAAGAILAITSIMMAWWGVNFFLGSGMHSYGNGDGGGLYVLAFVLFNCVAVAIGAMRYLAETGSAAAVSSEAVSRP